MRWLYAAGDKVGPWSRRVVVVLAFLGIPVYVWWSASGMITNLPLSPGIRTLLTFSVLGSIAFGLASGFLVWRDLDQEP